MKNKVLYFPYINVPNSIWFTRMLLYWDEVGAIVPYDFIERPERLDEHTRSLVQATLVKQVIPGEFLNKIPAYKDSFVNYLESLGSNLEKRRKSFKGFPKMRRKYRIHIEKMDELGQKLNELAINLQLCTRKTIPYNPPNPSAKNRGTSLIISSAPWTKKQGGKTARRKPFQIPMSGKS